jgi:hypothetical protein
MFWIALAAQLSMPVDSHGGIWNLFSFDDVPLELVPNGEARGVGVRVTVDPTGIIRSCQAEFSSGIPKLDAYTCGIVLRRAHFRPATGLGGQPAYGVVRTEIMWSVNASSPKNAGDLELTVPRLPKGVKNPAFAYVMFMVDEVGHPSACRDEEPPPPSHEKVTNELLQTACDQLTKSYVAIPAKDDAGRPVSSVQDAVVRFSTEPRR